jgi:hypothetical protein
LRLKIRKGELPYTFTDKNDGRYRKIAYEMGLEIGRKVSAKKVKNVWTIDFT